MNDTAGQQRTRSEDSFSQRELAEYALGKFQQFVRLALNAMRGPPYEQLARFSHDLGVCVHSAANLVRGLELCLKQLRRTRLGECWANAPARLRAGDSLYDALRPAEELLPAFYLPVVNAGEQSGRLDEALDFLESHCRLLAGPASALRNLWLFPLTILIFGAAINVVIHLAMGSFGGAAGVFFQTIGTLIQLAAIVAIVMLTPARYFVDQLRLMLPWIGPVEREIALHRFFRVLSLIYSVSGPRVEEMIRTAAETVSNRAARIELLEAAKAIEEQATISEAFRRVDLLTEDQQATIGVGEMSGTLEIAFGRISDQTGASLIAKLAYVQPILNKIVTGIVIMSILSTVMRLLT